MVCKKNSAFYYLFISFINWYRVSFTNKPKRCPDTFPIGKLLPVRVRVWVRVRIRVGGSFPRGNCPTTNQTMHVVVSVIILEQCKFWLQLTFFCCLFLKFKERSPIVPLPLSENFGMTFLTHFSPMFHFYTPWIHQKTKGFLTFSGGIEMEHWAKWVNNAILRVAEEDNMAIAIFLCIELVAISDLISKILYLWYNYFGARLIFLFAV